MIPASGRYPWYEIVEGAEDAEREGDLKKYNLPIVVEKDRHGYYAACPALQGCYTQGDTYEEALANIKDAIRLHIQDRMARGEKIETPEMVSVTTLEIAA
jgi:predicted RNase H-like HicB family nuclease